MAEYHTEQKKLLINFLREHKENSYTVQDICKELNKEGSSVGQSTVYRLMTKLVQEKQVRKQIAESSRKAVYRIALDSEYHNHLHLQCVQCGKILHLDEKISDSLVDTVQKLNNFSVSEEDTVLLGKCAGCKYSGGQK